MHCKVACKECGNQDEHEDHEGAHIVDGQVCFDWSLQENGNRRSDFYYECLRFEKRNSFSMNTVEHPGRLRHKPLLIELVTCHIRCTMGQSHMPLV